MKGASVLILAGLFMNMMLTGAEITEITAERDGDGVKLSCPKDHTLQKEGQDRPDGKLEYKDEESGEYTCSKEDGSTAGSIYVKFRTGENIVEFDVTSGVAIILANVLATVFIGVAVYSIAAQPKAKGYSGNKASDRQNLIPAGGSDRDTYQRLNGRRDEYSTVGGKRK